MIQGESVFNGNVDIKNGKLHDVQIASRNAILRDSAVNGNICVKKVSKEKSFFGFKYDVLSNQILELKGNTTISGDVIFEKEGEVHLFEGAKIAGKLVNARLIQK